MHKSRVFLRNFEFSRLGSLLIEWNYIAQVNFECVGHSIVTCHYMISQETFLHNNLYNVQQQ